MRMEIQELDESNASRNPDCLLDCRRRFNWHPFNRKINENGQLYCVEHGEHREHCERCERCEHYEHDEVIGDLRRLCSQIFEAKISVFIN